MAEYYIRFTAHIDERKRPDGFPREVIIQEHLKDIENEQHLRYLYNEKFKALTSLPGIVVLLEPAAMLLAGRVDFHSRTYIPWHMITHFHGEVKPVVVEKPEADLASLEPSKPEEPPKPKVIIH